MAEAGIAKAWDRSGLLGSIDPGRWSRGFAGSTNASSVPLLEVINGKRAEASIPAAVARAGSTVPSENRQVLKTGDGAADPAHVRWKHAWRLGMARSRQARSVRWLLARGTPPVVSGWRCETVTARCSRCYRTDRQASAYRTDQQQAIFTGFLDAWSMPLATE